MVRSWMGVLGDRLAKGWSGVGGKVISDSRLSVAAYWASSDMQKVNLFTYGTLMVPEIMAQVAGCAVTGVAGILAGYSRYGVRGEQYPGVVADPQGQVDGVVYTDVSPQALTRLDLFEGDLYRRLEATVRIKDTGEEIAAMVYVIRPQHRQLLTEKPWDFQKFLSCGREVFEREYGGFDELEGNR